MSKNSNTQKCVAIVKGSRCPNTASVEVVTNVNQGTARKFVPQYLEGKGWTKGIIDLCGTHANKLNGTKDPTLTIMASRPVVKEEVEMVDSPYGQVTQEQYDVMITGENPNNIPVPGPVSNTSPEKNKDYPFFCVNCKQYHATANDMRICMGKGIVDQPLLKNTPFTWTTESGKTVHYFKTMREVLEFTKDNPNSLVRPTEKHTGYNVFPTDHPYGDTTVNRPVQPRLFTEFSAMCGKCKQRHSAPTQAELKASMIACEGKTNKEEGGK